MVLPDVLGPALEIVFCGTAPGRASALRRAYYAGPGNFFWRALRDAGLTPDVIAPEDYASVIGWGIGLTDLNKMEFGQDVELSASCFDVPAFVAKVAAYAPARVAFTSKTAAAFCLGVPTSALVYGRQTAPVAGAEAWVLPSPSGQARRYWEVAPWRALGAAVREARGARGAATPAPVAPGDPLR